MRSECCGCRVGAIRWPHAEPIPFRHGVRAVSSIRPLATITLLAAVGIFLYLKINETEPILPEEVAGFEIDAIQFDGPSGEPNSTPQFGATFDGSSAPAFGSSPQTGAAASTADAPTFSPNAAKAPAWDGSQASDAPPALATPSVTPPANPVNSAPSLGDPTGGNNGNSSAPDLPPLPTLPPTTQAAGAENSTANVGQQSEQLSTTQMNATTPTTQELSAPPAFAQSALQSPPAFSPTAESPETPAVDPHTDSTQASLFSATRLAVEAALDRGELSQALLLLSDWYGDPSLSPQESQEVNQLLSQLAGSVIYSTEHRLEPPYMVQAGERLEDIAKKYSVPWQLLAKINGITHADQLQPGQQLKVLRGPFSALIDLNNRKMTLMLDRRYAGEFSLELDPSISVEEGHWAVNQKLLTPGNVGLPGASPTTPSDEKSLMLTNPSSSSNQLAIIRGSNSTTPTATEPTGRVIRVSSNDVNDVYDILSLGSQVVIRR